MSRPVYGHLFNEENRAKAYAARRETISQTTERVYRFVVWFNHEHGRGPFMREVSAAFGYAGPEGAYNHMRHLVRQGRVVGTSRETRGAGYRLPPLPHDVDGRTPEPGDEGGR